MKLSYRLGLIVLVLGLSLSILVLALWPRPGNNRGSDQKLTVETIVKPANPFGPLLTHSPSKGLFWLDAPDKEVAELLLTRMNTDQILAQLFLLGWRSEKAEGPIMSWIASRGLGGAKIFGWNGNRVDVLAQTLADMQTLALKDPLGIPLLTATDQEGGWVRHIKDKTSITPGNMAIGATGLAWDAYQSSLLIAKELRAMGVNMNFAPTVDVYTNSQAHVIGPRAYSDKAREVSMFGLAAFMGMERESVIATAKHFPGHGNAVGDSHGILPVVQDTLETLWNRELLPYRTLIPEDVPAILVGHLAFPKIDPSGKPATLSKILTYQLLREKLGFNGVVVTDDLFMGGAWEYGARHSWRLSDIVVESIKAGNDLVMLSQTPNLDDEVFLKLKRAYESDPEFAAQIHQSVRRILRMKLRYLKPSTRVPLNPQASDVLVQVPNPKSQAYFDGQAARAVSLVRKKNIPLNPQRAGRVSLIGQDFEFTQEGLKHFKQARVLRYSYEPFYYADSAIKAQAQALAASSDTIIFCLANPNSLEVLKTLQPWADKLFVISTLTPVYLEELPWVKNAIAVYGWAQASFKYGYDALLGIYQADGIMPLTFDKQYKP